MINENETKSPKRENRTIKDAYGNSLHVSIRVNTPDGEPRDLPEIGAALEKDLLEKPVNKPEDYNDIMELMTRKDESYVNELQVRSERQRLPEEQRSALLRLIRIKKEEI